MTAVDLHKWPRDEKMKKNKPNWRKMSVDLNLACDSATDIAIGRGSPRVNNNMRSI